MQRRAWREAHRSWASGWAVCCLCLMPRLQSTAADASDCSLCGCIIHSVSLLAAHPRYRGNPLHVLCWHDADSAARVCDDERFCCCRMQNCWRSCNWRPCLQPLCGGRSMPAILMVCPLFCSPVANPGRAHLCCGAEAARGKLACSIHEPLSHSRCCHAGVRSL